MWQFCVDVITHRELIYIPVLQFSKAEIAVTSVVMSEGQVCYIASSASGLICVTNLTSLSHSYTKV